MQNTITSLASKELRSLRLPSGLCERVEQRYSSRFGTLEELLACVLHELLRDDIAHLDRADQQVIANRLRDLGYL